MRTSDYLGKITPDNAAALFIDYQTQLSWDVNRLRRRK